MSTSPASPPPRRPLKRSASSASISLLTPPRTYRRRARGRSRGSCDSDSDDDARASENEDELPVPQQDDEDVKRRTKKRKLTSAKAEDEEAEARFWGADDSSSTKNEDPKASTSTVSRSKKPLLYQRFKSQSVTSSVSSEQGLVSPPPSHRKTGVTVPPAPGPSTPTPSAKASPTLPVTPVKGSKRRALNASSAAKLLRDSPSNPFVATPIDENVDEAESPSALPHGDSPTPVYDRPTLTYVFRGVKRVFHNPMYNHAEGRPLSPTPNSKLPPEHPDFSPDPTCKPQLLFPEAHKRKGKKAVAPQTPTRKTRARLESDSEVEGTLLPLGEGRSKQAKRKPLPKNSKADAKKVAAKPQAVEDDDPFC